MVSSSPVVVVNFPSGSKWVDYFDNSITFAGGAVEAFNYTEFNQFPVFYRAGSIIPLNITSDYVNTFGNSQTHKGYLTLAIHYPSNDVEEQQTIYSHGIKVTYQRDSKDNTMRVSITAPNNFRPDYKNMKIMLDIRGLMPSVKSGFKISQYSYYDNKYVDLDRRASVKEFSSDNQSFGAFYQEDVKSYRLVDGLNKVKQSLKHQRLMIKLHDIIRGVKLVIQ